MKYIWKHLGHQPELVDPATIDDRIKLNISKGRHLIEGSYNRLAKLLIDHQASRSKDVHNGQIVEELRSTRRLVAAIPTAYFRSFDPAVNFNSYWLSTTMSTFAEYLPVLEQAPVLYTASA